MLRADVLNILGNPSVVSDDEGAVVSMGRKSAQDLLIASGLPTEPTKASVKLEKTADAAHLEAVVMDDRERVRGGADLLRALVATGETRDILVIRGVAQEAALSLDAHRARSVGDVLSIDGAGEIAAAVANVLRRGLCNLVNGRLVEEPHKPGATEALALYRDNQAKLASAIVEGQKLAKGIKGMTPRNIATLLLTYGQLDRDRLLFILEGMRSFDKLPRSDARSCLGDFIASSHRNRYATKLEDADILYLFNLVWDHLGRKSRARLNVALPQPVPEDFGSRHVRLFGDKHDVVPASVRKRSLVRSFTPIAEWDERAELKCAPAELAIPGSLRVPKGSNRCLYRVLITPAMAQMLLDQCNINNRNVADYQVQSFAREMLEGRWYGRNGNTIKISADGILLDGQHRLKSIVTAGIAVECYVVVGTPKEAFAAIDDKKPKSFGNVLAEAYPDMPFTGHVAGAMTSVLSMTTCAQEVTRRDGGNMYLLQGFRSLYLPDFDRYAIPLSLKFIKGMRPALSASSASALYLWGCNADRTRKAEDMRRTDTFIRLVAGMETNEDGETLVDEHGIVAEFRRAASRVNLMSNDKKNVSMPLALAALYAFLNPIQAPLPADWEERTIAAGLPGVLRSRPHDLLVRAANQRFKDGHTVPTWKAAEEPLPFTPRKPGRPRGTSTKSTGPAPRGRRTHRTGALNGQMGLGM